MTSLDPIQPSPGFQASDAQAPLSPKQAEAAEDLASLSFIQTPTIPEPASNYDSVRQSLMRRLKAQEDMRTENLITLVNDELESYLIKVQTNNVPFENNILYESTAVFIRKFMEEKQKMNKQKAYEVFERFWTDTLKKNILKLKADEKTADAFATSQQFMQAFGKRMQAISRKLLDDANEEALREQSILDEMGNISNGMLGHIDV